MDFLFKQASFHPFGMLHVLPLVIIFCIGFTGILFAKSQLKREGQKNLIFGISLIPLIGYLSNVIFPLIEGDFNLQEDLPVHVCRVLAIATPVVIWYNKRYWMRIFYFWILAGTLNASITPDVEYTFPHWTYFNYWMVHSFLVIIPIYYVFVFKMKITFNDLKNAFWLANIFLISTYFINVLLGSNYMYSRAKPTAATILDVMGPWPVYLITGQLLALILFFLLYLPFYFNARR